MAKLKSEPKTKIDRIRDVYPRYASLLEKSQELRARWQELIDEIRPLSEQERRSQVSWVSQTPKPKLKPVMRHSGATALLGDLLPEQPPEEINPPPPRPSWPGEQRLRELGAESEAVSEAIKLIGPEIAKARKEYSRKVAEQRSGEYIEIAERIVDAAKVLGDALIEQHEFINSRRSDGVSWRYFRSLNSNDFGNVDEDFSPLRKLILDAVEKKHVSADQIPDWRMPIDLAYMQVGS